MPDFDYFDDPVERAAIDRVTGYWESHEKSSARFSDALYMYRRELLPTLRKQRDEELRERLKTFAATWVNDDERVSGAKAHEFVREMIDYAFSRGGDDER